MTLMLAVNLTRSSHLKLGQDRCQTKATNGRERERDRQTHTHLHAFGVCDRQRTLAVVSPAAVRAITLWMILHNKEVKVQSKLLVAQFRSWI